MGTHPIFESDFDCLTDEDMSEGSSEGEHDVRIKLSHILDAFNAPIKFDQSWAIVYMYLAQSSENDESFPLIENCAQIELESDGHVSIASCVRETTSEVEFLDKFGCVIFDALDYGNGEEDEPDLPDELDHLIAFMTGTAEDDQQNDDGYCESEVTVRSVLKRCRQHAGHEHSEHYQKVVKALHSEALELRAFLSKLTSANTQLRKMRPDEDEISELDQQQWSSAWLSVMRSLRSGVTLNRVENHSKMPLQFELAPYEMLLNDIRKKKYSLRETPQVPEALRKDTHDIILDFIRSRPPLNPASKRKLKTRQVSPQSKHERLMDEIKSGSILKSVPEEMRPCPEQKSLKSATETMRGGNRQPRKVIRVSQIDLIESDSDDEDVSFIFGTR